MAIDTETREDETMTISDAGPWIECALEDIGTFSKGQGLKKSDLVDEGVPCVRYGEIYTHHHDVIRRYHSFVPRCIALGSARLRNGDLLFAGSGETAEDIGKCVAFISDDECYAGGDIVILTPSRGDSRFLGYLMNYGYVRHQKANLGQGDAVVHIHARHLKGIRIRIPESLTEQRVIAAALSDVDARIENLERLIAKKRDLKTAVMQELLTGKRRLPGFDGEWITCNLGDIARIVSGGTPKTTVHAYWDGQIKWCIPSDITAHTGKYLNDTERSITEAGLANSAAHVLPPGTLLLCSRATIGELKIAGTEICTNQGFRAIVCHKDVNNEFVYYVLLTLKSEMVKRATGSTFLELSRRDTAALPLSLPPRPERDAIVEVLSDIDAEIVALESLLGKKRDLKTGMMQNLLTGRVQLV